MSGSTSRFQENAARRPRALAAPRRGDGSSGGVRRPRRGAARRTRARRRDLNQLPAALTSERARDGGARRGSRGVAERVGGERRRRVKRTRRRPRREAREPHGARRHGPRTLPYSRARPATQGKRTPKRREADGGDGGERLLAPRSVLSISFFAQRPSVFSGRIYSDFGLQTADCGGSESLIRGIELAFDRQTTSTSNKSNYSKPQYAIDCHTGASADTSRHVGIPELRREMRVVCPRCSGNREPRARRTGRWLSRTLAERATRRARPRRLDHRHRRPVISHAPADGAIAHLQRRDFSTTRTAPHALSARRSFAPKTNGSTASPPSPSGATRALAPERLFDFAVWTNTNRRSRRRDSSA